MTDTKNIDNEELLDNAIKVIMEAFALDVSAYQISCYEEYIMTIPDEVFMPFRSAVIALAKQLNIELIGASEGVVRAEVNNRIRAFFSRMQGWVSVDTQKIAVNLLAGVAAPFYPRVNANSDDYRAGFYQGITKFLEALSPQPPKDAK